jgi:hypothetical protein
MEITTSINMDSYGLNSHTMAEFESRVNPGGHLISSSR